MGVYGRLREGPALEWEGQAIGLQGGNCLPRSITILPLAGDPRQYVLDRRFEALGGVARPGNDEGSPKARREGRLQSVEHVLDLFC